MAVTFKHCLLPVWVANYRYREKLYHILVNGRTGKVSGERPYSFWKIFGLVALILLAIGAIIALVMSMQGNPGGHSYQPGHSRRQAISRPRSRRRSRKSDPVVEPAGPTLPELEHYGKNAIPPPVWRSRDIAIGVASHQLGMPGFEERAVWDDGALCRSPRAEPRAERSVDEVIVGFGGRDNLDSAFDADLPF
jgi:hypothetical protein